MNKRTSRINIVGGRGLELGDRKRYAIEPALLVTPEAQNFYAIRSGLKAYFRSNNCRILDVIEDIPNCLCILLVADDICNKLVEVIITVVCTRNYDAPLTFFVESMRCNTVNEVVFNAGWVFDDL